MTVNKISEWFWGKRLATKCQENKVYIPEEPHGITWPENQEPEAADD